MLPGFHAPRTKQCSMCSKPFTPARPLQAVCSPRCAARLGKVKRAKEKNAEKLRRAALETIPELIAKADREFMAYIRARDRIAGHTCISSGKPLDWSGNQVDAGHYRSRGAASHLRYDERNCHAQSKFENRYRAGNAVDYRINLIERIGLSEVEALEADNEPHHWTREELREIAATYRAKRRELERMEDK
jgi:predicted nucleic acid-binding Zn ribbon protein